MSVGARTGAARSGAADAVRVGGAGAGGVSDAKREFPPRARGALPADFYARPVLEVARELIGCVVEHGGVSGRIVETEAYHESEPACHAFVGITPRTRTLFDEPGLAYVYRSYGIHALLNAVCEPADVGAAVLIRALEPLDGVEEMRVRRAGRRARMRDLDLCSGPGKLTQALGVKLEENGTSLIDGPVVIRAGEDYRVAQPGVVVGARIGITKAVELRWRFCEAGNPHVSRPWPWSTSGLAES
jgi:DNA-3-methyladenine glycosylase